MLFTLFVRLLLTVDGHVTIRTLVEYLELIIALSLAYHMFVYEKEYDVIVIGGGHSGIEAALAAARIGCDSLILTHNLDTIGQMSCNPAVGGSAKGHIVREIDALGGEMGKATDMTGLQFRILNRKKGPAIWSPRAQCDRRAYQTIMKRTCERQPRLDIKQCEVSGLVFSHGEVCGVETDIGVQFRGKAVVVTTGTFLRGLMHFGPDKIQGGRAGDKSSIGLSGSFADLGLELGRLKTGTPPRVSSLSVDFSKMETQNGDDPIPFFSFWKDELFHVEQVQNQLTFGMKTYNDRYPSGSILQQIGRQLPCYISRTTDSTASIIQENLHKSPVYSGAIESVGPRYCPSIEDKYVRFRSKSHHQVFLEPEGITTDEIYMNGLSTSLPFEVQSELVRSVVGCEKAEILRPGYAVEYDYVVPTQLNASLELKCCKNLFLAGQINGTSGYEEAAGQGIIAGINAARRVLGFEPLVLKRNQAYIGVLIDDLVTKGTTEPYRMFTSRAEYRLLMRQDNADIRLSELGHRIGLLPDRHYKTVLSKINDIQNEIARLYITKVENRPLADLLRRPEIAYEDLPNRNEALSEEVCRQVEIAIKYEGYVVRQQAEVERSKRFDQKQIPDDLNYESVPGLRSEARQKLTRVRPRTLGQAGRISGVTPADISVLMLWVKRHEMFSKNHRNHFEQTQDECAHVN